MNHHASDAKTRKGRATFAILSPSHRRDGQVLNFVRALVSHHVVKCGALLRVAEHLVRSDHVHEGLFRELLEGRVRDLPRLS